MSLPKEHLHIPFLTPWIDFVGILGFQSMALRYQTPFSYDGSRCTDHIPNKSEILFKIVWGSKKCKVNTM